MQQTYEKKIYIKSSDVRWYVQIVCYIINCFDRFTWHKIFKFFNVGPMTIIRCKSTGYEEFYTLDKLTKMILVLYNINCTVNTFSFFSYCIRKRVLVIEFNYKWHIFLLSLITVQLYDVCWGSYPNYKNLITFNYLKKM